MVQVASDGTRITYDDLGRGEPTLLFMPGWCGNRSVFKDVVLRSSTHRHTLVLDWRGHGESGPPSGDFGVEGLLEDAMAVINAGGARQVVPVALAHAGWVAIELRRRLGKRMPKLVLLDWIVTEPSEPFRAALEGMQSPERWRETVERISTSWIHGVINAKLHRFVRKEVGSYRFEMWARAAREISAAYAKAGSPLELLSKLEPPLPVLHLYAQPDDPGYLAAQRAFAAAHPWFTVSKLAAQSHFPMFEVPDEMAGAIERFVRAA